MGLSYSTAAVISNSWFIKYNLPLGSSGMHLLT